jgi:hypothetical protein
MKVTYRSAYIDAARRIKGDWVEMGRNDGSVQKRKPVDEIAGTEGRMSRLIP